MKILFICTGNICRSVMAERLLEKLAKDRGLAVETASCGIAAQGYFTVPEPVSRELERLGIEPRPHAPRLVSRALLSWADIALTMTRDQRERVLDMFPEFTGKVHVFRSWAGLADEDIEDPMGRADSAYAASCARIREAVEAFLRRAAAPGGSELRDDDPRAI